ncbi:MAG TPA: undecaprenyl-phosphate glucose phosphotransferase [Methylotenera sp.]|nr:undecaprenyl-phosphate glucose phosphotransferase [Methylotenera sp.]HPH06312.1 undecaprenyl-phosphate glucose phosphotransferase [Methylotenera sp.]HPN00342.1 undecaprenyl-phosphate glucose phosphotransferase [Methylotenera sp.]
MNKQKFTPPIRRGSGLAAGRDNILYNTESLLEPIVIVIVIWAIAYWFTGRVSPRYLILSAFLFYITFPCSSKLHMPPWQVFRNITLTWLLIVFLVLSLGILTGYNKLFPSNAILAWLWLTPLCQIAAVLALRLFAPLILKLQGKQKKAIIVGVNEQGVALAESLENNLYNSTTCIGYFDDRGKERLPENMQYPLLGKFSDLAEYVKTHHIDVIYINIVQLAAPNASQPRMTKLLDDLKDTTASIYIVPDMFLSDVIQGNIGHVGDIAVLAVCESPIVGVDNMMKRLFDICLSILFLVFMSPIILCIIIGIKLSSPGPILFRQRRYGLDGKEISVYKFRSMTLHHSEGDVVQATKRDKRITRFGALLRKTSLDELPQFINVIQGRMSIVGPRPHAVKHNEMYRKLIKGYMIRHKVRPGITGWAQVSGYRGETETLDKMQTRIDYDLDYLRHWSLRLDIYIIFKTIWVMIKGQDSAY